MNPRDNTRVVDVGGVKIGGGNPVSIQSMTNTDTRDVKKTVAQIHVLEAAGCELVRVAIPDAEAANAIAGIKAHINIPLIADIHFDYRLALLALEEGADKLRINPGNIGGEDRILRVVEAAKARGVPIRVGVNGGSLEKDLLAKHGGVTPDALVESALRHVSILEKHHFKNIVISLKSSSVPLLVESYARIAEKTDIPLHVGVTEAGSPYAGAIKSAVGIGAVLAQGVGDTIRVSLTGDPAEEIRCAKEILKSLGLRAFGVVFISCPTCGRTEIDLIAVANAVEKHCSHIAKPLKVAVMGCAVNGPGEAKEADIGIAGGKGFGLLFKKGKIVAKVPENELVARLLAEIDWMAGE